MSMDLYLEVDIDCDRETVFSWIATPEKAKAWMTGVVETEIIDRKAGMVGTTFRERLGEGGSGIEIHGTVTAFEPDHRISFHLESRINVLDVDYQVDEVGDLVRLSVVSAIQWRFPANVTGLLFGRKMKASITEESERELARLKGLCETGRAE